MACLRGLLTALPKDIAKSARNNPRMGDCALGAHARALEPIFSKHIVLGVSPIVSNRRSRAGEHLRK